MTSARRSRGKSAAQPVSNHAPAAAGGPIPSTLRLLATARDDRPPMNLGPLREPVPELDAARAPPANLRAAAESFEADQ